MTGTALLLSSCSSYTATGAMVGGRFGNVVGSAIGGISGGWRGHELGALIGTVGGAVAGAAIGAAVENAQEAKSNSRDELPYDPQMRGDDRIDFDPGMSQSQERDDRTFHIGKRQNVGYQPTLELRNATVSDANGDGVLMRGETCTVTFEVMNNSSETVYDIYPLVEDVTGNKHIQVSPNLRIESIAPYRGIRYTATILADSRLKDGEIVIRVGVAKGSREIPSQTQEITVTTRKK